MEKLSEQSIIDKIESGELFEALVDTGAFSVRLENDVPAVFTAIHDGHEVDPAVAGKMIVSTEERMFEEDPFTGDIIDSCSITLRMHHSRYYYDVNRRPESCIYDEAWGKQVWRQPPSAEQQQCIRSHHHRYYRVLDALLGRLEKKFGHCVVYDLHSYNYARININTPLFNIGTHYIDRGQYESILQRLAEQLNRIELPGQETRAVFDQVFNGRGYQAEYIRAEHPASLCIPLEVKKIFMTKNGLALDPEVSDTLFPAIRTVLGSNAACFSEMVTGRQLDIASFIPGMRS